MQHTVCWKPRNSVNLSRGPLANSSVQVWCTISCSECIIVFVFCHHTLVSFGPHNLVWNLKLKPHLPDALSLYFHLVLRAWGTWFGVVFTQKTSILGFVKRFAGALLASTRFALAQVQVFRPPRSRVQHKALALFHDVSSKLAIYSAVWTFQKWLQHCAMEPLRIGLCRANPTDELRKERRRTERSHCNYKYISQDQVNALK